MSCPQQKGHDIPLKRTSANSSPKTITVEQGPKDTNRHESERNFGEGDYCPSQSSERGVLKLYISSGKKGWGELTCNQSQKL